MGQRMSKHLSNHAKVNLLTCRADVAITFPGCPDAAVIAVCISTLKSMEALQLLDTHTLPLLHPSSSGKGFKFNATHALQLAELHLGSLQQ